MSKSNSAQSSAAAGPGVPSALRAGPGARYSEVAIALHWILAAATLAMIGLGWWMVHPLGGASGKAAAYGAYQLHKSIGFGILALTLARLAWRLAHPPPPLPAGMSGWERMAARTTHAAFYAALIVLPLTGWIYVSTGWSADTDHAFPVATSWFGLFPIAHLAPIAHASEAARRAIAFRATHGHAVVAYGALALAALHAAAALKHHLVDRDGVLASMVPWLQAAEPGQASASGSLAAAAAGVVAVLGLTLAAGLSGPPHRRIAVAPAPVLAQAPPEPSAASVPRPPAPVAAAAPAPAPPAAAGPAPSWAVDYGASEVAFSGQQMGVPFRGRFQDWRADIRLDPDSPARSRVTAAFRLGSVRLGDATQQGTVAQEEWLDTSRFPEARFESTHVKALGGGQYQARGLLRLKDRSIPVVLPFRLRTDGGTARAEGRVDLDRTAFGIGTASDPTGEIVSKAITVEIRIVARRAPGP